MSTDLYFLVSLLITISIETTVLLMLYKTIYKSHSVTTKNILSVGLLTSFATLPYVWFIFPNIIEDFYLYMFCVESFAVIAETGIISFALKERLSTSFICSFISNMISFLVGLIIF